jgi:hypothetical protein
MTSFPIAVLQLDLPAADSREPGQMLKSFRDTPHRFACHARAPPAATLAALGPLAMPTRGAR